MLHEALFTVCAVFAALSFVGWAADQFNRITKKG